MKTPFKWLDRHRIAAPGPFLTLCLSEAEFRQAIAPLKAPVVPKWLTSHATTHVFTHDAGKAPVCVVCLGSTKGRSPIEIAGLLVHEAVHVWQEHCQHIGERVPGAEQEAYAIQTIAQELMAEYARRVS